MKQLTGADIKRRRKVLGYTQAELADIVGVSTRTLGSYERGEPINAHKLRLLQRTLYPEKDGVPVPMSIGEQIDTRFRKMEELIERQQTQIYELSRKLNELKKG